MSGGGQPLKTVERNLQQVPSAGQARDMVAGGAHAAQHRAAETAGGARGFIGKTVQAARDRTMAVASNRAVQVATVAATGGAAVLGPVGAAAGLLLGGGAGAAMGLLAAPFTFGLSIPAGAVLGGGAGLAAGAGAGGAAGVAGAGTLGLGAYAKREDIGSLANKARDLVASYTVAGRNRLVYTYTYTRGYVASNVKAAYQLTATAARATKDKTIEVASDRTTQVTAATATGGAVALGTGGAAAGLAAGGAIGAAVGVVPAIFTFGLSIPVFAAIGGTVGLATGSVVGGTTGMIGGSATGYGVYKQRDAIGSSVKYVKDTATSSADYVRTKLIGGTGGTTD